jgi:hypothetical protein
MNRILVELKTKCMCKFIFILFLFFCSLQSFSQKACSNAKVDKLDISDQSVMVEKEIENVVTNQGLKDSAIDLLLKDNLCEILSIKASDLLNESMLKKLKANV